MSNLSFSFAPEIRPLAARMRPTHLSQYIGQKHLLAQGSPLYNAILAGRCHSLILWGPPGVGKTTLAEVIAHHADAHVIRLSAVTSGVKEIRESVANAKDHLAMQGQRTLLFIDEVHRFNKSQQDAFLPHIEDGTFIFIGATTENPSFSLNNAILSRARVYQLKALEQPDLIQAIHSALKNDEQLQHKHIEIDDAAIEKLALAGDGDARRTLNLLEQAIDMADQHNDTYRVTDDVLAQVLPAHIAKYDKGGDLYYDLISAFHKSVRGSSPDGALYWLCRILAGGGDPFYVGRRLLAIATEDIGNADPRAMQVALNAWDIYHRVGPSEGERALAQAAIYLACAPKSNAVYTAFKQAKQDIANEPSFEVPHHLRNAPTNLMKDLGYGAEYRYAHDEPGAYAAGEKYLPEELADRKYYSPTERGLEQKIKAKLDFLLEQDALSPRKRYDRD
ncbi:replication-associated recombination protein A [Pseudoalteromonas piratica]|uniref:Replication-associated recombination protein A n=1 Tax=Pseudoalteromonas piratica TaxID=1348114 RepID=A0A0A7EFY5_9GAMM|nr:replication-associated recombination protein A [Pseudoalteromonas piratica]AIY65519.1 recombination factor protein RarA [Pseudoalteromonas piratica]